MNGRGAASTEPRPARHTLVAAIAVVAVAGAFARAGAGPPGWAVAAQFLAITVAVWADLTGARFPLVVLAGVFALVGASSLFPSTRIFTGSFALLATLIQLPVFARMLRPWMLINERAPAIATVLAAGTVATGIAAAQALSWESDQFLAGWFAATAGSAIAAAVAVFGVALLARWYADDPADHPSVGSAERVLLHEVGEVARVRVERPLRTVIRMRETWMLTLFMLLFGWACAGLRPRIVALDIDTTQLAAASTIGSLVGFLAAGFGERRLIMRRGSTKVVRRWLALVGLITGVVFALGAQSLYGLPAAFCVAVMSFAFAFPMPGIWSTCLDVAGKYTATLVAIVGAGAAIGTGLVGLRFGPLLLAELVLVAAVLIVVMLSSTFLSTFDRVPAVKPRKPPMDGRLACAFCYFPGIQFYRILKPANTMTPNVRFHVLQALGFYVIAPTVPSLSGSYALWGLGAVATMPIVLAILAFAAPSYRIPLISHLPDVLTKPPAAGERPVTLDNPLARTFAVLMYIAGAGLIVLVAFAPAASSGLGTMVFTYIGAYAFVTGRRLSVHGAQVVLAKSSERPVLYLRSFAIDEDDEGGAASGSAQSTLDPRDEETIADLFGAIGPVIAVGRPGEQLPQLGAARFYFRNDEWEQRVRDLIDRSQLVVMRVGLSPGFMWEVQNVVNRADPSKVVLYFSHRLYDTELRQLYVEFRAQTARIFPVPLPLQIHRERFLTFDAAWKPSLTGSIGAARWNPGKLLVPPFGGYIVERLNHRRLALSMREWFAARGLTGYAARLFGPATIAVAGFAAGPLAAGALLTWNFIRTQLWVRATLTIVIASIVSAAYARLSPDGAGGNPFVQPDIGAAMSTAIGFLVFAAANFAMPPSMKRHFQVAGPVVPGLVSTVLIVACTLAWLVYGSAE